LPSRKVADAQETQTGANEKITRQTNFPIRKHTLVTYKIAST